jgi:hypothetical protein
VEQGLIDVVIFVGLPCAHSVGFPAFAASSSISFGNKPWRRPHGLYLLEGDSWRCATDVKLSCEYSQKSKVHRLCRYLILCPIGTQPDYSPLKLPKFLTAHIIRTLVSKLWHNADGARRRRLCMRNVGGCDIKCIRPKRPAV